MGLLVPNRKQYQYDLAILGHICLDYVILGGTPLPVRMGGPPIYIGLAARKLGLRTKIVSKIGGALPLGITPQLKRLNLSPAEFIRGSKNTTSYQLKYQDPEHRTLKLLESADRISIDDVKRALNNAVIYAVAPIVGEVTMDLVKWLGDKGAILFIDVQGFIRRFSPENLVYFTDHIQLPSLNPKKTILKGSEIEIAALTHTKDPVTMALKLAELGAGIAIITRESRGCVIFDTQKQAIWDISAYTDIQVVDSTGAGDAFTAGFVKGLLKTASLIDACKYGNATASFILETLGPEGFPTIEQIRQRAAALSIDELALP